MWYHFYTQINLFALCGVKLLSPFISSFAHTFLMTTLWTNSWAIFVSYHASPILLSSAWSDFRKTQNQSLFVFWRNNLIGHYLPIIYIWYMHRKNLYSNMGIPAGITSACIHILWTWMIHGGWEMHAYVSLPRRVWMQLWKIAIATHICTGLCI